MSLIRWTDDYLTGKGFQDARLNAELLLAGVLRLKRLDLYLQHDRPLTEEELGEYKGRLRRRVRREPLQYIEGTAAFRHLTLRVDRRVLIPRPETECLVDEVLRWAAAREGLDVLDIGTGSGAIALSLRAEGTFGRVVATDLSAQALELAQANAVSASVEEIDFRLGAFYDPVPDETFDVIVSNPPYVAERDRATLPAEVREWEPSSALFAGENGLEALGPIIQGAVTHLRPGGLLAIEIGADQAGAVSRMVEDGVGFTRPTIGKDLAGRDRMLLVERLDDGPTAAPAIHNFGSRGIGYTSGEGS